VAAGAYLVVELAFAGRYGHSRDELYFLACADHMAWGFVDQPPLTPALAWLQRELWGESVVGLRVLPMLAGAACVVLAGALARRLGAGAAGQALAAACVAAAGVFLVAGHLLTTTVFDLLAWTVVLYVAVRVLGGSDERLWLLAGAVAGVGLLNKWSVAFLGLALLVGLALADRRRLRSPWPWLGAALALALWVPNLAWQVDHDWPTLDFARELREENSGLGAAAAFLAGQVLVPGPLAAPVWLAGLWWLLRSAEGRPYRALGWAYLSLVALFVVAGGKDYYTAGLLPVLFAAGAVALERRAAAGRRFGPRAATALAAAGGLVALPVALPVLPARTLGDVPLQEINYDLAESIAWPRLVGQVARAYHSLPPGQRTRTAILTGNYGEAGAIERFGSRHGLPTPFSGHNGYWLWGPPPGTADTVLAVGFPDSYLGARFPTCRRVGRLDNGLGVDNEEQGRSIHVCRGAPRPWPRFKHYE
jgi:Dolichyl-phosphate-mannose-protein mannosyltransferase